MTLVTGSLTTLATAKDELGIASGTTTYDTYLERLIAAATAYVTSYCDRTFHYGTGIAEEVGGYGTNYLSVNRMPLLSITSIVYDSATINSADYSIDGDGSSGLIYSASGWAWSTVGGAGILSLPKPGSEEKLYTITYTGGYVTEAQVTGQLTRTLPYDLEDAVIQLVVQRYRARGRDLSIASESLLNASVSYKLPFATVDQLKTQMPQVYDILESYRRMPLL